MLTRCGFNSTFSNHDAHRAQRYRYTRQGGCAITHALLLTNWRNYKKLKKLGSKKLEKLGSGLTSHNYYE
jgi:hypothetical protein